MEKNGEGFYQANSMKYKMFVASMFQLLGINKPMVYIILV